MYLEIFILVMLLEQCTSHLERRVITSLKYSKNRVKLTVVSGEPANITQVPYLVSIKESSGTGLVKWWSNLCGGNIISEKKILTAAHCFEANWYQYANQPERLRAVAGNIKTSLWHSGTSGMSKSGTQWRKLEKVILHQKFMFPHNDIAVAITDHPWRYTDMVRPIALARRPRDSFGDCITAGYGKIGYSARDIYSPVLLLARVQTMSRAECTHVWEMVMDDFVCTTSVMADVSEGDSGGPLTCFSAVGPERGESLVGLVSGKNFDTTTLYTRVSSFQEWIDSNFTVVSSSTTHSFSTLCLCICICYLLSKLYNHI